MFNLTQLFMDKQGLNKGKEAEKTASIPVKQGETTLPKKEGEVTAKAVAKEEPKAEDQPKQEAKVGGETTKEEPKAEAKVEEVVEEAKPAKRTVRLKNLPPSDKFKVNTENIRKLVDGKLSTKGNRKFKQCYCCGKYFEVTRHNFTFRADGMIYNHCRTCQKKLVKDKTELTVKYGSTKKGFNDSTKPEYKEHGYVHYYKHKEHAEKLYVKDGKSRGFIPENEMTSSMIKNIREVGYQVKGVDAG